MKKIVVFIIIAAVLVAAYFLNNYLQKQIKPRKSFGRLMLYFLITVVTVLGLMFLMVFIIGKLYPKEIMK